MNATVLDDRGVALVTLVIAMVIFGTLIVGVQILVSQSAVSGVVALDRARALYLAEAGVNDAFWELKYSEKLYGPPSQDFGVISSRTVSFEGDAIGYYNANDSSGVLFGRGFTGGLSREVSVGITTAVVSTDYTVYQAEASGLALRDRVDITGTVFCRGDLVAYTPAAFDEGLVEFHVEAGRSAYYSNGSPLGFEEIDPLPVQPSLDSSLYAALIARADASGQAGPVSWKDVVVGDTVLIDGNLSVSHHGDLSRSGVESVIVVNGHISISHHCTMEDNMKMIAEGDITITGNFTRIGSTSGRSGNLLYSQNGTITIGQNGTVNGVILTPNRCVVQSRARMNGLIATGDRCTMNSRAEVYGAVWAREFASNRIESRCIIDGRPEYLPLPLPSGLIPPGGEGSGGETSFAAGWKETGR